MEKKIGFTIGKFAPLHRGHQLLIETAIAEMDELYVIIYETDRISTDIKVRANWIKRLYPEVIILYAYDPPSQYGLDKQSVEIQINYIKGIIKDKPFTHFYSSEEYGKYVAESLNLVDRRVDNNRELFPISGTKIRNNIQQYRGLVEEIVYQDLKKEQLN